MANLLRDARFGFRLLYKRPAFAAVAILTIALGIAANSAIFSVIYGTYLAPLPYRDADRLVMIWTRAGSDRLQVTAAQFVEWKRQATVFDDLNGWGSKSVSVTTDAGPEALQAGHATPGFLAMLGYGHPLALGRTFSDDEGTVGRDVAVVLTHRLWRERFGADLDIIGRAVPIDGKPHTVVGVLAAGPPDHNQAQLWLPLAFTREQLSEASYFSFLVMGRLKHGVTLEQANAHMAAFAGDSAKRLPLLPAATVRISVEPFRNNFVTDGTKAALWLLVGAVAFVLLIACANVANLLLARGSARQRELAVRLSLGASRAEIVRQLLTESVLLATVGGALGVALAYGLVDVIVALMPPFTLPTEAEIRLSVPVVLFTLGASVLSGVLFGCAPAWQAAQTNVNSTLKEAGRSPSGGRHRLRRTLVVVEFALALTLLTAGGLAVDSFYRVVNVDPGFRTEGVLTFSLPVPLDRLTDDERITAFYGELLDKIQALPGVVSASVSPVLIGGWTMPFSISGQPPAAPPDRPRAAFNIVSPDYFRTLGIRITRGRAFTMEDRAGGPPVAIVNERFVRQYFPDVDPLTQRVIVPKIAFGAGQPTSLIEWQIVGVHADIRNAGLEHDSLPAIFLPFRQSPWPRTSMAVRTAGNPAIFRQPIAAVIRTIDPNLPMGNVKTVDQIVGESMAGARFNTVLFAGFAGVALLLAAVGIYGVMSFVVAQRTHEIGLRLALGAEAGRVLRELLREGMMTALAGTLCGSVGAYFVSRAMQSLLVGVTARDPTIFAIVALTLLGTAMLACFVPARRAAAVDPMIALRQD